MDSPKAQNTSRLGHEMAKKETAKKAEIEKASTNRIAAKQR